MAVRRILTLAACVGAAPVMASPRTDPTIGRAVFTGATMPSSTSVSLNPAALGLSAINEIFIAVTSLVQQVKIERRELDIATGALAAGASIRDTQLAPGAMLGFAWHPSERLTLGFEARLPPAERFPDGHEALSYQTLGGGQRDYLASVGVSLRVPGTDGLFVGATLTHRNTVLDLRYARDTALEAGAGPAGITSDCGGEPCGVEHAAARERYDVVARSPTLAASNLQVHVGTVFRIYRDVWIGLAYHTPPGFDIQTTLDGSMRVTRAPRDGGEVLEGESNVNVSYPASIDGELRARLPRDLELHVGARWEDLSRMQAFDVRGFGSTFRANGIPEWVLRPRGLHDSFAAWGGVEQVDLGQPIRVGARLGFATSELDADRTSALTIAPGSVTLDAGIQARLSSAWTVQLGYGLAFYPSVDVTDSAFDPRSRIDCIESGYDYETLGCRAVREGYAIPTAAGIYDKLEHAFRLGFRYELP